MADNEIDLDAFIAGIEAQDHGPHQHPAYNPGFGRFAAINARRRISRSGRTDETRPAPDNRQANRRNIPKQGARRPGGYDNFGNWLRDHRHGPKGEIRMQDIHHENINFLHHGQNTHNFLRPLISYSEKNANNKSCAYGKYKDGDRYRCIKNPNHHTRLRANQPQPRAAAPAPVVAAAAGNRGRRGSAIPAPTARRSARLANR